MFAESLGENSLSFFVLFSFFVKQKPKSFLMHSHPKAEGVFCGGAVHYLFIYFVCLFLFFTSCADVTLTLNQSQQRSGI